MKNSLRLLKFDSVYPFDFLLRKQAAELEYLSGLCYEEYYDWLMGQRLNFSDFLTCYMNEAGWQAREVISLDDLLLRKLPVTFRPSLAARMFETAHRIISYSILDLANFKILRQQRRLRREYRLANYIRSFQPDVLCVREPSQMKGSFWDRFRERCLIVGFIGCATFDAWEFDARRHDLIFSLTEEYKNFFSAEDIDSYLFSYGVDERLVTELGDAPKEYDCTFVGYLGIPSQRTKTALMEFIAQHVDFKWWGVRGPEISENSALHRSYQGPVAGIEMFRIYKQSKTVVNEYPEIAASKNVNMRTMEVLNVGSFLLTRAASNIEWLEKAGALVTFNSPEDCLKKLRHYLADDAAREKIAAHGLRTALKHFNYRDIARGVMEVISSAYEKKRSKLKPWSEL
jgi:hypothetical protein